MALMFKTCRDLSVSDANTNVPRLAGRSGAADALSAPAPQHVRALAPSDRKTRRVDLTDDTRPNPQALQRAHQEAKLIGTSMINPAIQPADARLVARFGAQACLKHRILPWKSIAGRVTLLAATRDQFLEVRDTLTVLFGPVHLAIVTPEDLDIALRKMCHNALMDNAELRTPARESCRGWDPRKARHWGGAVLLGVLSYLWFWPIASVMVLCGWAVFTLVLGTLLKVAAAVIHLRTRRTPPDPPPLARADLPMITILVPLFGERDVAGALVQRLSRLTYPSDRLDVCLVLECDDTTTQDALKLAQLPPWMRAIRIPLGTLQTKPRAMNYALCFAKGSIIGVYDAEDAPAPDQLQIVANRFAMADPDVACLQGWLDFYNARSNWLARCFSIEYATWFHLMLPALERMGLAIPLGGTTLFFRRDILEDLGGWDAHNVTEDADLGIRLTRHGYRTEIINTVTCEEANARAWPWIKQRSRWLKGYAITYGVHMRNPLKLWRDLGTRRFLGVQLLFAGTISQFLMAPLLWSFWLMLFGLPHPLEGGLSSGTVLIVSVLFLSCEIIGITVSAIAVTSTGKPDLIKWTPTQHVYFMLAALAAYKGVFELATKPFYWDKTAHGIFAEIRDDVPIIPPQPPLHPIAAE